MLLLESYLVRKGPHILDRYRMYYWPYYFKTPLTKV